MDPVTGAALITAGAGLFGGMMSNSANADALEQKTAADRWAVEQQIAWEKEKLRKEQERERLAKLFDMKSEAADSYDLKQMSAFDKLMQSYGQILS